MGDSSTAARLQGKRLLVTRSAQSAQTIERLLRAEGAKVLLAGTTTIEEMEGPARQALAASLQKLDTIDWVFFTSQNAVHACEGLLCEAGLTLSILSELQIAATGQATEAVLRSHGLQVDLLGCSTSEELARKLVAKHAGKPSILYPRAQGGREEPVRVFREHGCQIEVHDAYRSVPAPASNPDMQGALLSLREGLLSGVVFFAPSQVHALCASDPSALAALQKLQVRAAIGPTTAAAMSTMGLHADAVADVPTSAALVDKIIQAFS